MEANLNHAALIAKAQQLEYVVCTKCDGDGVMIAGWDENAYENIEATCDICEGTGYLKKDNQGLIPQLVKALEQALAENEVLKTTVKALSAPRIVILPADDSDFYFPEDDQ